QPQGRTHRCMDNPGNSPIKGFLDRRAAEGATGAQLADMVVDAWQQVEAALSPVIGQRGVAALYKRSLHLASPAHPWLAGVSSQGVGEMDFNALRAAMADRTGAEAAAAGANLLLSFHGLVGSLIGPALSGQLLGAVWAKIFSGPAAQDPPP
ncbi:MAG: hypothetical protein ABW051_04475, partial [Burkholderiaceae bacterium]